MISDKWWWKPIDDTHLDTTHLPLTDNEDEKQPSWVQYRWGERFVICIRAKGVRDTTN